MEALTTTIGCNNSLIRPNDRVGAIACVVMSGTSINGLRTQLGVILYMRLFEPSYGMLEIMFNSFV